MLSNKLRYSLPLLALAGLTSCNDDENRIAGAGIGLGGSAVQDRLGGFSTVDPDAVIALVGDVDGIGVSDYAIGDPSAPNGGMVTVRSGIGQAPILTVSAPTGASRFGAAIAAAGDVNKDGKGDLLVGAPGEQPAGAAYVISGADGSVLRRLTAGNQPPLQLGSSVALLGDVNQDGARDYMVGASGRANPTAVYTISGANGSVLDVVSFAQDPITGDGPTGMHRIGDIDADSVEDIVVGFDGPATPVLSGASGTSLRTHPGRSTAAANVFDLDADGVDDYVVGYPERNDKQGQAEVFSGATGARLFVLQGTRGGGELGRSVAGVGDRSGDGVPDVLLGGRGYARLFSGANGQAIGEQRSADPSAIVQVKSLGDLNADGAPDYVIGTGNEFIVFSGEPQMLAADRFELPLGNGGTQELSIDAGTKHANDLYFVLGSLSGVSPGSNLGNGLHLPLNADAFTNHTATQSPSLVFANFIGRLDENGRGNAQFVVPGNLPPGLEGVTLYFAAMISEIQGPVATTNPVSVTFVR